MKVYHGSYIKIGTIDLEKCEIGKDFGRGFYVTKIRKQAEFWAERKGLSHKTAGFVTEFDFNENAHDKIATRINDYLSGKLLKQDFLDELKFFKETHQICFRTARSLQMLDYIENPKDISYEISKIGEQVVEKLMLDNNIDELQATDLFYNSDTFAQLAEESTQLYEKLWQEVYERLKKELGTIKN
ncbi:hypothetical protein FACS1894155_02290 [Bacteroidia bacterium]|nr:hypothetical protein FACS1894155_02290 [Bacteroidia bacterium]